MDSLFIVIPAYNEESSLEQVVREWYSCLTGKGAGSRLVINCSGSTDRTLSILQNLCPEFPALEWLTNSANNYGAKLLDLYRYAIEQNADYIFQTDSNMQTNAEEFAAFWELRKDYDIIIGNRKHRDDGCLRSCVQWAETHMIRHYFHVKVPDANSPFRLMNRLIAENYLAILPASYSMPNILLTALTATGRETVCFREISFGARKNGKNSINFRKIIAVGRESRSVFRKLARRFAEASPTQIRLERIRYFGLRASLNKAACRILSAIGFKKFRYKEIFFWDINRKKFQQGKIMEFLHSDYFRAMHRHLDLKNPITYCEKSQWLKIYDATELKTMLTDKIAVKDWITRKVGEKYVIPTYNTWKDPAGIDFDSLPDKFMLKVNHSTHMNVEVKSQSLLQPDEKKKIKKRLANWLDYNFATAYCELEYLNIVPAVLAEKLLPQFKMGSEEYKLICINGKVVVIYDFQRIFKEGEKITFTDIYTPDWKRLNWHLIDDEIPAPYDVPAPATLQEMIEVAEKLSEGFALVRVDLYDVAGKLYVGELTFTPGSGYGPFSSLAYDIALGRMMQLPDPTPPPLEIKDMDYLEKY